MRRSCTKAGTGPPWRVLTAALAIVMSGCSGNTKVTHPASSDAALITDLWLGMLIVGTGVLVAVLLLMVPVFFRRDSTKRPSRKLAWAIVLGGGVLAPFVAAVTLVVVSIQTGHAIVTHPPEPSVTVDVIGRLWWWEVRYLDDEGEPIAVTANEIHIPVGQPVQFRLISDNVIHSFWVPELQGKTDLIPGQINESWIEADEVGVFRGQCAEFCGTQHALMGFLVFVEPEADFREWLAVQAEPAEEPETALQVLGKETFMAGSCKACHTIRGTAADGELGPDLTHLASRSTLAAATILNTEGHLGGWVANPQQIKPGALMPHTALDSDEFIALLAYLQSLR
jgi:cytochrome c oxidase subunit 2